MYLRTGQNARAIMQRDTFDHCRFATVARQPGEDSARAPCARRFPRFKHLQRPKTNTRKVTGAEVLYKGLGKVPAGYQGVGGPSRRGKLWKFLLPATQPAPSHGRGLLLGAEEHETNKHFHSWPC